MNARFAFLGAVVCAAALAACGGGGGGGGGSVTPVVTLTPSPTPTYPGGVGSTYAFAGSLTQSDTYTYPLPSPLPSTSAAATLSEALSVGSATPPPGATGATTDFHGVLNEAFPLSTTVLTSDTWYGPLTTPSTGLGEFASTATDNAAPIADSMTTVYATGQLLDENPETNGATWTNSPAASVNATFSDGSSLARTVNADGTFSETEKNQLGYTFIDASNADGSGSYTGTGIAAFGIASLNASAPTNNTITISATLVTPSPSPSATPASNPPIVFATPAAWFAAGTPMYKETDTLATGVAYPSACAVPSAYGTSGSHISRAIDTIDPMIGTSEHLTTDTYESASAGPVCVQMSDTIVAHYDYLLDTASAPATFADFTGTAIHTQTIAQQLTLQNETLQAAAHRTANVRASSGRGLSSAAISAARAQFSLSVAKARHVMVAAFMRHIQSLVAHGRRIK